MRAIRKVTPTAGFELTDVYRDAALGPTDVRVQVAAASICGSDRLFVEYGPAARGFNLSMPVVLGHEFAGVVIERGDEVDNLGLGDHVALESHLACGECYFCASGMGHNCLRMQLLGVHVDGGFAERAVVPARACFPLPPQLPLEVGALFESAGVAVHAMQRSGHEFTDESVLVAGAGPIGLVLVQLAAAAGARRIAVVEPTRHRALIAERLGATVFTPSDDVAKWCRNVSAERGGFDVGFDCSGAPGAFATVLDSLRNEATAMSVGLARQHLTLDTSEYAIRRGLTIKGSYGRSLWDTWHLLLSLVQSGQLDLESLISHRLPLSEFDQALDLLDTQATKIVLLPQLETSQ